MLDAVAASAAWLKPDGRCCPAEVSLYLGLGQRVIPAVQRWRTPLRGLDLAPAESVSLHTAYPGFLRRADLLGPGAVVHTIRPPTVAPFPDAEVVLHVVKPGVLRELVGWWVAELAPEVSLSTEPGSPTHWGQYLWPLPETEVIVGDRVRVQLSLVDGTPEVWRWRVRVSRAGRIVLDHSAHSSQHEATPGAPSPAVADPVSCSNAATEALTKGDVAAGVQGAMAATRGATDDAQAAVLQENLGLAFVNAGRLLDAVDAFLASLHEGPRPQALRFLVGCALRLGWADEAEAWRDRYEAEAGPWTDPFLGD